MSRFGQGDDDAIWPYGPVVFGCGNFGGIGGARDFVGMGMSEEASLASMDEAAEMGIALFDTAERYAAGGSERIIGRWRKSRPSSVTQRVRISTGRRSHMEHLVPRRRYPQRLIAVDGHYTRSTHAHPKRHNRTNRSIATLTSRPKSPGRWKPGRGLPDLW